VPLLPERKPALHVSSNAFTVHGLWPNNYDGQNPEYCDDSALFSTRNVDSQTLNEMYCEWPDYDSSTPEGFWGYEWSKHGTCSIEFFDTFTDYPNAQDAYFTTAIDLNNAYDPNIILNSMNGPTTGIDLYEFKDAFEEVWGVSPWISCDDRTDIFEMYICIDKDLSLMDCPSNVRPGSSCQSTSLSLPAGVAVSSECLQYMSAFPTSDDSGSLFPNTTSAAAASLVMSPVIASIAIALLLLVR
jgi:ribonuclease I